MNPSSNRLIETKEPGLGPWNRGPRKQCQAPPGVLTPCRARRGLSAVKWFLHPPPPHPPPDTPTPHNQCPSSGVWKPKDLTSPAPSFVAHLCVLKERLLNCREGWLCCGCTWEATIEVFFNLLKNKRHLLFSDRLAGYDPEMCAAQ